MATDPWCTSIHSVYWTHVEPVLLSLLIIPMIILLSIHARAYIKSQMKISKMLFYTGSTFLFICTLHLILWLPEVITFCNNPYISHVPLNINFQLYGVQTWLLLGIFYYRLYIIFRKSRSLRLSKRVIYLFWSCYICIPFVGITGIVVWVNAPSTIFITIFSLILGTLIIFLAIYLVILFINKLYKTYQQMRDGQDSDTTQDFVDFMIKSAVLAFISIFNTLLTFIMWPSLDC